MTGPGRPDPEGLSWKVIAGCQPDPVLVERLVRAGDHAAIAAIGDAVVHISGPGRDVVISSGVGLVNYYWSQADDGSFILGPTVADVLEQCGRTCRWNHQAIADHLIFGHPLEDATVDRAVFRIAPSAVSVFTAGAAGVEIDPVDPPDVDRDDLLGAAINAMMASLPTTDDLVLSLSGGLDSRLLLAALLEAGRRPRLVVSGLEGSFDRSVSMAIARTHGLEITPVVVGPQATAAGATQVARVTNGLLPATNWSGLEHLRSAPVAAGSIVVLGFGGEYARSYYSRWQPRALVVDCLAPRRSAPAQLARSNQIPVRADELGDLHPDLAEALEPEALRARLELVCDRLPGGRALDVTDEFFLTQYCRQKLSSDLAAIGTLSSWSTPLLARGWVAAVRALGRRWKIGDRFHRAVLARLRPDLLDLPEEGQGLTTPATLSTLDLVRRRPPIVGAPYLDGSVYTHESMLDSVLAAGPALDGLVASDLIERVVREMRTGDGRPQLCYSLGALGRFAATLGPQAIQPGSVR